MTSISMDRLIEDVRAHVLEWLRQEGRLLTADDLLRLDGAVTVALELQERLDELGRSSSVAQNISLDRPTVERMVGLLRCTPAYERPRWCALCGHAEEHHAPRRCQRCGCFGFALDRANNAPDCS